jgi:Uma2 family endonuclease
MSTHIEQLLTVTDLDAMPDDGNRYEIIEGELFVSRAPGLTHQRVSGNMFAVFRGYLDHTNIGEILATPGLILSDLSGVIPDLVFVSFERRGEIASGERITGAPDLIIEITSPGMENERRDRVAKRQLYGKYGVKEYWVVDLERRLIEVDLLEGETLKLHATLREDDDLTSLQLPGFTCKVGRIFRL